MSKQDSSNLSSYETEHTTYISSQGIVVFSWIVWTGLGLTVVLFGIISNIINITCFIKQGFKESINVSLTGLAISDLGCLVPLLWTNMCYTPAFGDLELPFEVSEFQYITSGITHVTLTRISSWITATITLERCLCVAMPLKVKNIATPKGTLTIVICIFVVLTASASPQYLYYRLGHKFYQHRNKTLLGIIYTEGRDTFENWSYPINFVFVPFAAFVVITVCTSKLVVELNEKAKWRKTSATSGEAAKLTTANKKVAKMVVMISTLFICCFIPVSTTCILMIAIPGFSIDGPLGNFVIVLGGLGFFLESVNSSMNIFIYYHMSNRFRNSFHKLTLVNKLYFKNKCENYRYPL